MQMPTVQTFTSLLVPLAYLTILIGSLATFSSLYRKRQTTSKLKLSPYFPPHTARNIYMTLLHQADTQQDLKKVPDSLLIAALQERACEDILRIREIQTRKQPLNTLLQRGVVGDEIWQRLLRAEQELEAELKDVVAEANALAPGWGTTIFQTANEVVVNRMTKAKVEERRRGLEAEKKEWDAVREKARLELEGGSVEETTSATNTTATPSAVDKKQATTPKPATVATEGSDEDTVLVEKDASPDERSHLPTPPPETGAVGASGGGGGKKNKKKGKK